MHSNLINIVLAFLEGFALIISPCILPILPIVLSGSLTGSKKRPLGIITGFIIAFTIVTLFSRSLIELLAIDQDTLRNVSYFILFLLGVVMLSTTLTEKFNLFTQRLANVGNENKAINNSESGYMGGVVFGLMIGIIWTPCAGPILAAVIVQAVVETTSLSSILTVIAFGLGAGLPMLIIALLGRRIMGQFGFFREHAVGLRQLLGLIIIFTVLFLVYGNRTLFASPGAPAKQLEASSLINGISRPYPAPAIAGIDAWINSPPLQLSDFKGKVVLVDFWTYSCINCIRTLPYLKDWYAKYHDQGFEIIGVHSPEFQFEHDLDNVKQAVEKFGITYPVGLDNHFVTWQNYHNEYWPAHYLINKNGDVVYENFGEGEYDVTENNIRFLLGLHGAGAQTPEEHYSSSETPETYLGYARAENFSSPNKVTKDQPAVYRYPSGLSANRWALQGKWIINEDKIVAASSGASIKVHFDAAKVYAVMGSNGTSLPVKLLLNGAPITAEQGKDVVDSQLNVSHDQLYSLLSFDHESEGMLEIIALSPGLQVYTFTFGD